MSKNRILVTGCAGFIGFHLCRRLLREGWQVTGLDNLNDYYDPILKTDRLAVLADSTKFEHFAIDITDYKALTGLFQSQPFKQVIHLAAQAGVRYSKSNPHAYTAANLEGFLNILEACRHHQTEHLIYASSSSVYGANRKLPFSVDEKTDRPVSLYGATKKANELMAHSYSWLYGIPCTGLRFFTVYGPWGRPDMALYIFANAILDGKPIQLFNHGKMRRDFTYVDDVVEAIVRLIPKPPEAREGEAACKVYNVGNHSPVDLDEFVKQIEHRLGKKAHIELSDLQPGDVVATYAEVADLENYVGFKPSTSLDEGIRHSIEWFLDYRQKRRQ